jgi:hypothetical protein
MTRVTRYLTRMVLFVAAVGIVILMLLQGVLHAFSANPGLNGVILGTALLGIIYNFRMVLMLRREINWLEAFRSDRQVLSANAPLPPRLLAPLANMLGEKRERFSLSALSMRSLLDGLGTRLDELREISRYLIGLLIFLGLLGTFWGLLGTIASVRDVVGALGFSGTNDVASAFDDLKRGLEAPLGGMSTAFSASLFGLAGSLALGFLDLQAGQAQNRFYNDVEDWLSSATRLSSGALGTSLEAGEGVGGTPSAYLQALMEQTAENLEALQRTIATSEERRRGSEAALLDLTDKLSRFTDQMKAEQSLLLKIGESQMQMRPIMNRLADAIEGGQMGLDEQTQSHIRSMDVLLQHIRQELGEGRLQSTAEIRNEIKLLARTISALAEEG